MNSLELFDDSDDFDAETDDLDARIDALETADAAEAEAERVDALEDQLAEQAGVLSLCERVLTELLEEPGPATPARLRAARALMQVRRVRSL